MTMEEEAIKLSKAVILLAKYGYIQTYDQEEESQCEHFREIALKAARNIQQLARNGTTK